MDIHREMGLYHLISKISVTLEAMLSIVSFQSFSALSIVFVEKESAKGTPVSPPLFTAGTNGNSPRTGSPSSVEARRKESGLPYSS